MFGNRPNKNTQNSFPHLESQDCKKKPSVRQILHHKTTNCCEISNCLRYSAAYWLGLMFSCHSKNLKTGYYLNKYVGTFVIVMEMTHFAHKCSFLVILSEIEHVHTYPESEDT